MATPIAQIKELFLEFLKQGCNFDKLSAKFKKPMLVKVFRTQPYLYVSDKENYLTGYFPKSAMKKFQELHELSIDELKGKTLRVEKFRLELNTLNPNEHSLVSYLNKEVRLVIEEFSLSRPLKRGKDVNKYVVNICRDDEVKMAMAKYDHQERVKNGDFKSLDDYLKNDLKISFDSVYEPFESVYYGNNPKPKANKKSNTKTNPRFKLGELVTCVVEDVEEPKPKKKSNRRVVKKIVKQDAENEAKAEKKELETLTTKTEDQKTTTHKPKRIRKTKKALKPKKIDYNVPKPEVKMTPAKKEKKDINEIEEILQYSKNSKSTLDMEFLNPSTQEVTKTKKPKKTRRTPKRLSKFTEYMQWYDERAAKGKASTASKGGSTTLSTPLKISHRISQRIAKAKAVR